jgi:hypothetical protein
MLVKYSRVICRNAETCSPLQEDEALSVFGGLGKDDVQIPLLSSANGIGITKSNTGIEIEQCRCLKF